MNKKPEEKRRMNTWKFHGNTQIQVWVGGGGGSPYTSFGDAPDRTRVRKLGKKVEPSAKKERKQRKRRDSWEPPNRRKKLGFKEIKLNAKSGW